MSRARNPYDADIISVVEGEGPLDGRNMLHRDMIMRAALAVTARQLSMPLDTRGRLYAVAIAKSVLDNRFRHAANDIKQWDHLP
jgi:hypothetical protein